MRWSAWTPNGCLVSAVLSRRAESHRVQAWPALGFCFLFRRFFRACSEHGTGCVHRHECTLMLKASACWTSCIAAHLCLQALAHENSCVQQLRAQTQQLTGLYGRLHLCPHLLRTGPVSGGCRADGALTCKFRPCEWRLQGRWSARMQVAGERADDSSMQQAFSMQELGMSRGRTSMTDSPARCRCLNLACAALHAQHTSIRASQHVGYSACSA